MTKTLVVQIWSDIACPWCYLGKRRLDAALAEFPHKKAVRITWKAFELDRSAPPVYPPSPNYVERLAAKYGMPVARATKMIDEMAARGAKEDVVFAFDKVQGVNTSMAHGVLAHAAHLPDPSVQSALAERLFRAYFSEGRVLSDSETLVELAEQVGMPADAVRTSIEAGTYASEVRAEQAEATAMGVTGVPFFTIGRYAVEGAQSTELLLRVLDRAWQDASNETEPNFKEGAVCGPDGC